MGTSTAQDEAFAKAKELKTKAEAEKVGTALEKKETTALAVSAELMKKYTDNANLGSEESGMQSPLLKIHATGRSTSNVLGNGEEPNNGWFFYAPTGEQFKEVECHILCISRGYRVESMSEKKKLAGKTDYNQLLAGVIVNDGKPRTFIMYMSGKRLQKMWDFGMEAGKYKKAKPFPIPLFALRVKLTTEKETIEYEQGKKTTVWLVNFEIMKTPEGAPVIVADEKAFNYLVSQVAEAKNIFDAIIEAKEVNASVPNLPTGNGEVVPGETVKNTETVNPSDIPF